MGPTAHLHHEGQLLGSLRVENKDMQLYGTWVPEKQILEAFLISQDFKEKQQLEQLFDIPYNMLVKHQDY